MTVSYWNHLAGDDNIEPAELFLRIREMYLACLKHLYNDPKYIPDFRIHFAKEQRNVEQGLKEGYPVCTLSRRQTRISESIIHDLSEIENFENSFTWYQDDIFIVFDFRADSNSPLLFITRQFWGELFRQFEMVGLKHVRIDYMYEPLIASGVMEFFYSFYHLDINLITTLTAATYESNYINATVYVPLAESASARTKRNGLDIAFREQVSFSAEHLRQVRKLMEMSDKYIALVISKDGKICGLTADSALASECIVRLWGHLTWTITYAGGKISYYDARYHMHTGRERDLDTLRSLIRRKANINEDAVAKVEAVILEAVRQQHGTILIIGNEDAVSSESDRLCAMKNGTAIYRTSLYEKSGLMNYLTAIDGAAFMDWNCSCTCIGAILDGDAVTPGSTARGARYNSTVNYVARRSQLGQEFIGIVVSEDGTVDAVTSEKIIRLNLTS